MYWGGGGGGRSLGMFMTNYELLSFNNNLQYKVLSWTTALLTFVLCVLFFPPYLCSICNLLEYFLQQCKFYSLYLTVQIHLATNETNMLKITVQYIQKCFLFFTKIQFAMKNTCKFKTWYRNHNMNLISYRSTVSTLIIQTPFIDRPQADNREADLSDLKTWGDSSCTPHIILHVQCSHSILEFFFLLWKL